MAKYLCIVRAWFKIASDDSENISWDSDDEILEIECKDRDDKAAMKNSIITKIKEIRGISDATEPGRDELKIEVKDYKLIHSLPLEDK